MSNYGLTAFLLNQASHDDAAQQGRTSRSATVPGAQPPPPNSPEWTVQARQASAQQQQAQYDQQQQMQNYAQGAGALRDTNGSLDYQKTLNAALTTPDNANIPLEGPDADQGLSPQQLAEKSFLFGKIKNKVVNGELPQGVGDAMMRQVQVRLKNAITKQPSPQDQLAQALIHQPDGSVWQKNPKTGMYDRVDDLEQRSRLALDAQNSAADHRLKQQQQLIDAHSDALDKKMSASDSASQAKDESKQAEADSKRVDQGYQRDVTNYKVKLDAAESEIKRTEGLISHAQSRYDRQHKPTYDDNGKEVPVAPWEETDEGKKLEQQYQDAVKSHGDLLSKYPQHPGYGHPPGTPPPPQTGPDATTAPAAQGAGGATDEGFNKQHEQPAGFNVKQPEIQKYPALAKMSPDIFASAKAVGYPESQIKSLDDRMAKAASKLNDPAYLNSDEYKKLRKDIVDLRAAEAAVNRR